jgi:hypothetical protein
MGKRQKKEVSSSSSSSEDSDYDDDEPKARKGNSDDEDDEEQENESKENNESEEEPDTDAAHETLMNGITEYIDNMEDEDFPALHSNNDYFRKVIEEVDLIRENCNLDEFEKLKAETEAFTANQDMIESFENFRQISQFIMHIHFLYDVSLLPETRETRHINAIRDIIRHISCKLTNHVSECTEQQTNHADSVYYSAVKKRVKEDPSVVTDLEYLEHIIGEGGNLSHLKFTKSLFPSYIQDIISERVGNSGYENELPALVGLLMFAGTDLIDNNDVFLEKIVKTVYRPTTVAANPHFNAQQALASFLFGISVDYVSTPLPIYRKCIYTKLTCAYAAHSYT